MILITLANSYICFGTDTQGKLVNDNTGGASAQISFRVDVVRLLTIETSTLVLNIGPLAAGETKVLGEDYETVFKLNGVANSKFVINMISENYSNNGVTIEGLNWEYRNSESYDYTKITSFPFVSQLNQNSGDGWIKVFPLSVKTDQNLSESTVFFEFKFNCSYYEL